MKKSTLKLIVYTILGLIASVIFYHIDTQANPLMPTSVKAKINISVYICPFIGLIYWLFCRQFDGN